MQFQLTRPTASFPTLFFGNSELSRLFIVCFAGLTAAVLAVSPGVRKEDAVRYLAEAAAHLDGAMVSGSAPLPLYAKWQCAYVLGSSVYASSTIQQMQLTNATTVPPSESIDVSTLARLLARVQIQREVVTFLNESEVSSISLFGWDDESEARRLAVAARLLRWRCIGDDVPGLTVSLRVATEFIGPASFARVVSMAAEAATASGETSQASAIRRASTSFTVAW